MFNVGTGEETSVVALWDACLAAAGKEASAVNGPARLGELQRSCLDPRRAETTLHWRAEVPLATGLTRHVGVDPGGMSRTRANGFASWTIRFASIASSSPSARGGRQPS